MQKLHEYKLSNVKSLIESFGQYLEYEVEYYSSLKFHDKVEGYSILTTKNTGIPILIIPSLINNFNVLDISEEYSFIAKLEQAGYKVFLLDWHSSNNHPSSFKHCEDTISSVISKIYYNFGKVILTGHCMGGILCLPILEKQKDKLRSFISIATPVSFKHAKFESFSYYIKNFATYFNELLLRDFFYLSKPFSINNNLRNFSALNKNEKDLSARLIEWVNNNTPISKQILFECCDKLIDENSYLGSVKSDIESYVIIGKYDSISPIESTIDISRHLINSTTKIINTGHIGLITKKSEELTNFIVKNTFE